MAIAEARSPGRSRTEPEPGPHILIVEDEPKISRSLQAQLARHGYVVDPAYDGSEGARKAIQGQHDLILLDINLPDGSGLDILRELRSRCRTTPVLVVSARDTVGDRVDALQLGADDYLVKPFDSAELLARIQAIHRRAGSQQTLVLTAGDLTMDLVKRQVRRGNVQIALTAREFALLEFFLRNQRQVLTRKRIAEQVWGYKFDTGTNVVGVYVSYLRKAVDDGFTPRLIHTVLGEGFMLKDE
ncbi:MAG TPA: response regulator transcription factor [Candidatus Eisenbacteria bacterium]